MDAYPTRFTISELAEELDVSTRTIRYYEEMGLIKPGRSSGGTRFYTRKNRARLKLILRGRRFGFTIKEIKEMISLFDVDRTGRKQLTRTIEYGSRKLAEMDEKMMELQLLRDEIAEYKRNFEARLADMDKEKAVLGRI
ncbi:MAG TPA: MerR family DNA-binding transcriptional regulator [Bacillales bacterium]|nr:MerR family DNA-binding transcriptional regulator [Bacillales bacterium]